MLVMAIQLPQLHVARRAHFALLTALAVVACGCAVMMGGNWTMSEASALVTEPAGLETTTLYKPALDGVTLSRLSVALVPPVMSAPLKRHW